MQLGKAQAAGYVEDTESVAPEIEVNTAATERPVPTPEPIPEPLSAG